MHYKIYTIFLFLITMCTHSSAQNGCAAAVTLTPGTQQCGNSVGLSGDFDGSSGVPSNPCDAFYNDDEYWFTYTSTGTQTLDLTLSGITNTWAGLFVIDACAGAAPACVASSVNTSVTTNLNVNTGVLPAGTYYIIIANWGTPNNTAFCLDATIAGGGGSGSTPGGGLCADIEPICTSTGVSFTANATGTEAETLEPGNDYGCLTSSPDPAWYYLEIGVGGNIDMQLSAPNDVDFALWGPFTNLTAAQASCGSLPAPIDCSYDASNTEDVNITGGIVGEVYILVITNYDGSTQVVNLTQTGGTGATNCSAVCGVDAGVTTTLMSNSNSNDHYLCFGESVDISTTGEILPTAADIAGLGYFIYTDLPTVADPDLEPNWTGYYYTGAAVTETNSVGNVYDFVIANPSPFAGSNGIPSNNQLVFIPITMDDIANIAGGGSDNNIGHDIDGDGCYDLGDPVVITYLNAIVGVPVENCGTNLVITLSGGYPEFSSGSSYTVTNTGDGTMVQTGTDGEILTFTGYNIGDTISISVTDDDNGCTYTFSVASTCSSASCDADAGNW